MSDEVRAFWEGQISSIQREDDAEFLKHKAREHVDFISPGDRSLDFIDLGCGAGELLAELCRHLEIATASDMSSTMLDQARSRLPEGVDVVQGDGIEVAQKSLQSGWMSCQALNQYLAPEKIDEFLRAFNASERAEALYLFDSVDPYRYRSLNDRSRFDGRRVTGGARTRRFIWRWNNRAVNLRRQDWASLGVAMGYGYTPQFWMDRARMHGLGIAFGSSRYYEYRFHVAIHKDASCS